LLNPRAQPETDVCSTLHFPASWRRVGSLPRPDCSSGQGAGLSHSRGGLLATTEPDPHARPIDGTEGKRFASMTHWNVSWRYRYRNERGACRIDKSEVSIVTVTVLPEWMDKAHGTPVLRRGARQGSCRLSHAANGCLSLALL
jgi:hypothetical protein